MGSQVSFAYTITNSGEFTNGVTFVDYLPATGATFVSRPRARALAAAPSNHDRVVQYRNSECRRHGDRYRGFDPGRPDFPGGTVSLGNSGSAFVGQSQQPRPARASR